MKRTYRVDMEQLVTFYDFAFVDAENAQQAKALAIAEFRNQWDLAEARKVRCNAVREMDDEEA